MKIICLAPCFPATALWIKRHGCQLDEPPVQASLATTRGIQLCLCCCQCLGLCIFSGNKITIITTIFAKSEHMHKKNLSEQSFSNPQHYDLLSYSESQLHIDHNQQLRNGYNSTHKLNESITKGYYTIQTNLTEIQGYNRHVCILSQNHTVQTSLTSQFNAFMQKTHQLCINYGVSSPIVKTHSFVSWQTYWSKIYIFEYRHPFENVNYFCLGFHQQNKTVWDIRNIKLWWMPIQNSLAPGRFE